MKRIFKRIMLLALTAFTAMSSVVYATPEKDYDSELIIDMVTDRKDYQYRDSAGLLEAMGVLKGFEDDTFDRYADVKRADFAIWAVRTLRLDEDNAVVSENVFDDVKADHYAAPAIKTLKELKIVSGEGDHFRPDDKITLLEAAIILTGMTGRSALVSAKGGYPYGWMTVAGAADILKNVSVGMNDTLTKDNAVMLLANAVQTDIAVYDGNHFSIASGRTILSEYYDIYYTDGIVTSNGITGLSTSEAQENCLAVDDRLIACDKNFAKDDLGYMARVFYIADKNKRDKAIYIMPHLKNRVLEIEGDDAWAEYNAQTNEIRYETKVKTQKAALAKNFKIIYNGKADGNYTEILKNLKDMKLRLLDNDNDNKFDVLFITKYRDVIVKSVNTQDGVIYDYYSGSNNLEYGDLPSGAWNGVKDKYGNEVKLEDLYSGQVLSVLSSKDREYNEVIALDDSVEGTVEVIREDGKYEIGGNAYAISSYYKQYGNQDLYIGASGSFKLDMDGKIAAFARESDYNLTYGYVDKVRMAEHDRVGVRIYTTNRGVSSYLCAERLKTAAATLKKQKDIYDYIAGGGPNEAPDGEDAFVSMLVRFSTNKDGEIDHLEFASDEPKFNTSAEKGGFYIYKQRAYRNYKSSDANFGEDFMINAQTVMIEIITNETDMSNKYRKLSLNSLANNDKVTVTAFADSPNPAYASVVVAYKEKSETYFEYNPIAVNEIVSKVNSDGDIIYVLSGYDADGPVELEGADESTFRSVSTGDIISVKRNAEGKINEITKVYSAEENELKNPGKNTDYDSICKYELLTPYSVAENTVKYNTAFAPEEITKESQLKQRRIKKPDSVLVLHRASDEKYTVGTLNELVTYADAPDAYDSVFMYVNYTEVRMVVIIKNEK